MSKLIIAEKPMLARAILDALPGQTQNMRNYAVRGGYTVVSAFGHLLTLKEPEDYDRARYGKWSLDTLPIYFPDWGKKPGEGKEERLNLIGELLKDAECVIHAGDPDDEGQYLIDEILHWFDYRGPVYRLQTGDTTEAALRRELSAMTDNRLHENTGWSAHARSVADIMVGFNFSRYFSLKNPNIRMLTVGRVQTPTLGLVVTRDYAIENHVRQVYYVVSADLQVDGRSVPAVYEPAKDDPNLEDGRIVDRLFAQQLSEKLKGAEPENIRVTEKQLTEQPPLPFNLVKLQTYCSAKFGYDPSQTLAITQTLRDRHNAITYNRSDCQYLSEEQYKQSGATMQRILRNLDGDPAGAVFAKQPVDMTLHSKCFNDKNITAHTAIIPQDHAVDMGRLSGEERNVYLAICKYYVAQFLPPAQKRRTSLECALPEGGALKANSTEILSPGFLRLIRPEKSKDPDAEEESELSLLKPGTYRGSCTGSRTEEKETKAPPRYTKASLNEDMTKIARYVTDPRAKQLLLEKDKDKKGENGSIGTSATRATIIDNLEERGFIESVGKQIRSTQLGRELYRILPEELKKPDMTGLWWAVQESISEGTVPWTALTDSVLEMIRKVVKTEYPPVDVSLVPPEMRRGRIPVGRCPRCGNAVVEGERGFGCMGYKNGCKFTVWKKAKSGMLSKTTLKAEQITELLSGSWVKETRPDEAGNPVETGKMRTEKTVLLKTLYSARTKMTYAGNVYLTDEGPDSPYGASFGLESVSSEREPVGVCPRCGKPVVETAKSFGCSGYAEGCKFVIWKSSRMKLLANVTFTKADAKKFLAGKPVHKKKLAAKDGSLFEADIVMVDQADDPYGPVYRVAGTEKAADKPAAQPAEQPPENPQQSPAPAPAAPPKE